MSLLVCVIVCFYYIVHLASFSLSYLFHKTRNKIERTFIEFLYCYCSISEINKKEKEYDRKTRFVCCIFYKRVMRLLLPNVRIFKVR